MSYKSAKYYNNTLYGLQEIEKSITDMLKFVSYLSKNEQQQLIESCFFAANAHDGQKRNSGEPYICHPIKVAEILAREVQFDLPVLQAGVLHDVIEDTSTEKAEIAEAFSDEVADLVDGVSKFKKAPNVTRQEIQARTFNKLVIAMEADPRVVMIKFADRMHNMQTLGAMRPDQRSRIAQETLEVYVPIARRLGMFVFKTQLEELVFKNTYPWRYKTVEKLAKDTHPAREKVYNDIYQTLMDRLSDKDIKVSIRKRRRNLSEVYQKISRNRINRRPLTHASIPLVIITESKEDCYRVLGEIHDLYMPVFQKLADYIASPKVNGYQSLHTSVLTKTTKEERRVINFQIRTKGMHSVAESGIIAMWREHNASKGKTPLRGDKSMRRWLGNFKDLSKISTNPIEFYKEAKNDLVEFEIQVLTPKAEPIALPEGATVIDFAYNVHTDLGDHLSHAEVNGVQVPIEQKLSNGQMVEIFTDASATPHSGWLKKTKTARARTAIRRTLRNLPQDTLEEMGYKEFEAYLARRNTHYRRLKSMLTKEAKNRELTLGELLQRIALYEIRRRDIYARLQAQANKDGNMAVILVNVYNNPGVLANIAKIIGQHNVNILHLDTDENMQATTVDLTFEVHFELQEQLHHIKTDLEKESNINHVTYTMQTHEEQTNEEHYLN